MFDDFFRSYDVFQECRVENPLLETLRLFDFHSGGALSKCTFTSDGQPEIDLVHVANERKAGVPMEYILGQAAFMGHTFHCCSDTLIPTEETSLLVHTALELAERMQDGYEKELTIIDMGTGCGNVAVCLALNSSNSTILASDVSHGAVEVAQKNVTEFGLQERVSLFCGDLFSPFYDLGYEERIDLVVCNPPYIPTSSLSQLPLDVITHEPRIALDAGPYGIDFYRRLIKDSLSILKPGGVLVFEIGAGQEKLVARLFAKSGGYDEIEHFSDGMQTRVMSAAKKVEG